MDTMRQSVCLVTVYSNDFLLNCTTMCQALDSMTIMKASIGWLVPDACLCGST